MDRRRRKSQEAIMNAFIQLLSQKNLSEITMNEIAEKADVSRGTIYSNFYDKYDLLDQCIEQNIEHLFHYCLHAAGHGKSFSKDILHHTFEYLEKHASLYKILFNNNGSSKFRERLLEHSVHVLEGENSVLHNREGHSNQVMAQFLSSGVFGVLFWWITNDQPCSMESVTDQLWDMLQRMIL